MNDPRSSNVRGGAAKQATTDVSDLGYRARRVERPRRGLTWIAEHIFYPQRTRKARREPLKPTIPPVYQRDSDQPLDLM